ncbi:MAG: IS21 family transposase [Planctomycetota bacterium]|jgi:transposase
MISVPEWAEIRRLHKVEKLSKRAIAQRLGIHRNTVTRALESDEPPEYQREPCGSILDPYKPKIHALLAENPKLSSVRILEIIQGEHYAGKLSILRDFVREVRPLYKPQPVYIRMEYHPAEYAQVDWGEMPDPVLWQGHWCTVNAFVMVLCYSRLLYVEFSLTTKLPDFLRCHQNALHFFGAVPKCCVYDNLSSVVKRRRGTDITLNETFQHFAGYYCFRVHPCWPGAANQKGAVERPIDYVLGNFWAGRYFADFDDLARQCTTWLNETANVRVHRITRQRPVDRFEEERSHLFPLPAESFDTDWVLYPKMSKDCVVRVDTNDYSVPWQVAQKHLRQPVEVRVDGQWVRILDDGKEAARHPRCYARHQQIIDRAHYDGLWQSRAAAAFATLERGFLEAYGDVGRHFYTGLGRKTERLKAAMEAILRLERQYSHEDIVAALETAVQHGYFDAAAVQYLLRTGRAVSAHQPVTPTCIDVPVEERALDTYDHLYGGDG